MGFIMIPNGNNGFNTIITPTSQPAKCPNCHETESIKRVCNHCQYVYPEKPVKETMLEKIALTVVFCFLFFATIFIVDLMAFNSKYFNKIIYGKECDYPVPTGYSIVLNKNTDQYAVSVPGGEYLWQGSHGITTMSPSISQPTTFDTDCEARAYLKAYLKNFEIDPKGFK